MGTSPGVNWTEYAQFLLILLVYLAGFGVYQSGFGLNQIQFLLCLKWLRELIKLPTSSTCLLRFLRLDIGDWELFWTKH